MLRHAVIPERHVIFLPAPTHLKFRFGNMGEQEVQQRVTLLHCQIDNPRGETFVDEQRLSSTDRMGTHYRVQQRWVFLHGLLPTLVLFFT
ncbi:hypothetical protein SSYM_1632, partial [Serratia symbiotica str. Tucson]